MGHESAGDGRIAPARWIACGAGTWLPVVSADVLAAHATADANVGAANEGGHSSCTGGAEVIRWHRECNQQSVVADRRIRTHLPASRADVNHSYSLDGESNRQC